MKKVNMRKYFLITTTALTIFLSISGIAIVFRINSHTTDYDIYEQSYTDPNYAYIADEGTGIFNDENKNIIYLSNSNTSFIDFKNMLITIKENRRFKTYK